MNQAFAFMLALYNYAIIAIMLASMYNYETKSIVYQFKQLMFTLNVFSLNNINTNSRFEFA